MFNMIDIHTHIVPGVDDGSESLDDSLEMAAMAADSGVRYLVATPHANQKGRFENYFTEELIRRFQHLQEMAGREVPELSLYLGMEIYASEDMEDLIREGYLIGLNGSRYYLVEWGFDEDPSMIAFFLQQIRNTGGIPVIAHPERYFCVQDDPGLIYEWIRQGACAQINKGSLFGKFGHHAQDTAEILLANDLVTCVATDAHSPRRRTTFMGDAYEYMTERFGELYARRLMLENPMAILRNEAVPPHGRKPQDTRYY